MHYNEQVERLAELAQRIFDILADGRRSIGVVEASQWKALALTRWEMMRALDNFIEHKSENILKPMVARGNPQQIDTAVEMMLTNEVLKTNYERFVTRWALHGPASVGASYRTEAMEMADRIEEKVIADVQQLEVLLG